MVDLDLEEVYRKDPYKKAFEPVSTYVSDLESGMKSGESVEIDIDPAYVDKVALIGIGGSGIIGRVASQLLSSVGVDSRVISGFSEKLDKFDFAVAVSHSGNTAETMKTVFDLLDREVKFAFITSDGLLEKTAEKYGIPVARVRGDVPPRFGFPNMLGAMLGILKKIGLYEPEVDLKRIERFRSGLAEDKPIDDNPAKQVALKIMEASLPIVYVYDEVSNAGYRLKCQLNENAKMYCGFAEIPEAFHNDIEGLEPGHLVIFPRSAREGREIGEAIDAFIELRGEDKCVSIRVESDKELEELLEFFAFMDYVSLYVSVLGKVDPLILPRVTELRRVNKAYEEILGRVRRRVEG